MDKELVGDEYRSELSPWLANGALSARYIYHECQRYKKENPGQKGQVDCFISQCYFRDYFRLWYMHHGFKGFSPYGIYDRTYYEWKDATQASNMTEIVRWQQGLTGIPIIDALMRDMNATGFMNHRGRMMVASYLVLDLKQDWRHGAYYFEDKLIDYDVCSNWGGWNFSVGLGPGRVLVFNAVNQSIKLNATSAADYIRLWIPELAHVPN
jgi:deoxyribodipyrimidine photo-lyase